MPSDFEIAVHRAQVYAREVIRPALFGEAAPLTVEAWQCDAPVPIGEARRQAYTSVPVGWRWGPAWSTAWFHLTGSVPASMAGRRVALRFSSGTEALLYDDDVPWQGFDQNRDVAILHDPAAGGELIDLYIEAACNHPFGVTAFAWDPPEMQVRWEGETPGILRHAEVVEVHEDVRRLLVSWKFTQQLLETCGDDAGSASRLATTLRDATRIIDDRDVPGTAADADELLRSAFNEGAGAVTSSIGVGHAHIDTAWLWPLRETRRKCQRSFANVLRLMERHPDFNFICSQAQQYAWIEADAPGLFEQIKTRVGEGRWEPIGAMWVEPDCNVPSGESLVRQILYGARYWRDRFGEAADPQRILYLPDTFGFPASLPQIMRAAGLDLFITNKLCWNETNEFPHMTFRWRGIDGTEVLSHFTPGHDYNAKNSPAELRRGETNAAKKDRGRTGLWLQPFGYGDGGGGPTDQMIERARLAADTPMLPRVRLGTIAEFHQQVHTLAASAELPVWDGELYLELHRGTLTTHGWLKRSNRRIEHALFAAEWLLAASGVVDTDTQARLDHAWKTLLLNQFHDILPGTSIAPVYDDARQQMAELDEITATLIADGVDHWASRADTAGMSDPIVVFNPTSVEQSGVVDVAGEAIVVDAIPALGMRAIDRATYESPSRPAVVNGETMSNGIVTVTIDQAGHVTRLRRDASGVDLCEMPDGGRQSLNQLVLYEDRPRSWEAWDIESNYEDKPTVLDGPTTSWAIVEDGPARSAIEVTRPIGAKSQVTQRFILEANTPRVDVHTTVDWHEDHRLLRVLFPTAIRSRFATSEIQFGYLERPTHRNTSWDAAAFETCAHGWVDLSQPGMGLAILNNGRYGHSCDGGCLGLSLLRSPTHPDPGGDNGVHEFTYAMMPHDGDWRAAGVLSQSRLLNRPMMAVRASAHSGACGTCFSPLTLVTEGGGAVEVVAVKPGDDGRMIVRLVEVHGGQVDVSVTWANRVTDVMRVDLLERETDAGSMTHADQTTRCTMRPFEIVTLSVRSETI